MAIVDADGDALTKAQLLALTDEVTSPTLVQFSENVYETFTPLGVKNFEGYTRLKFVAGQVIDSAVIDAIYTAGTATVDSITPATGAAAGGTDFVIKGTGFNAGATVTIGGGAATALKVVNSTTITGKTPAHAAGAVSVVVNDPSGNITKASFFTYTA